MGKEKLKLFFAFALSALPLYIAGRGRGEEVI
jgi:hypothetical protein